MCRVPRQVAYLLIYGELPSAQELSRWDEALMRHSAVPVAVEVSICSHRMHAARLAYLRIRIGLRPVSA